MRCKAEGRSRLACTRARARRAAWPRTGTGPAAAAPGWVAVPGALLDAGHERLRELVHDGALPQRIADRQARPRAGQALAHQRRQQPEHAAGAQVVLLRARGRPDPLQPWRPQPRCRRPGGTPARALPGFSRCRCLQAWPAAVLTDQRAADAQVAPSTPPGFPSGTPVHATLAAPCNQRRCPCPGTSASGNASPVSPSACLERQPPACGLRCLSCLLLDSEAGLHTGKLSIQQCIGARPARLAPTHC